VYKVTQKGGPYIKLLSILFGVRLMSWIFTKVQYSLH